MYQHTQTPTTYHHYSQTPTVLAVWVWGNAEKVLRETPPSCSNLPTKSFPFSEKVVMPPPRRGEVTSLIFRPGYGQYGNSLWQTKQNDKKEKRKKKKKKSQEIRAGAILLQIIAFGKQKK